MCINIFLNQCVRHRILLGGRRGCIRCDRHQMRRVDMAPRPVAVAMEGRRSAALVEMVHHQLLVNMADLRLHGTNRLRF